MSRAADWGLQLRIGGALALVLGINGLLFAVILWSVSHLLGLTGYVVSLGETTGLALTVATLVIGAVGLAAIQARYGVKRAASSLQFDSVSGEHELSRRVQRLAALADVPAPSVALTDRAEPVCLTVGTHRSPTIVVSSGLLEVLSESELEAALAHEIAHLSNRDLTVAATVAGMVAAGEALLERERRLRRVLVFTVRLATVSSLGILFFRLPIVLLCLVYLVLSPIARTLLAINSLTLGLFATAREYAADWGGALLTGNPAALASALETLEDSRPDTDVRLQATAALGIVSQPISFDREEHWLTPWLPDPALFESPAPSQSGPEPLGSQVGAWIRHTVILPVTTRFRRRVLEPIATRIRTGSNPNTHPPTARRIDRLRTLERSR